MTEMPKIMSNIKECKLGTIIHCVLQYKSYGEA